MSYSLLIVGSDKEWSLESSYSRAFQQLGWEVHFWEPSKALHKVSRGYHLGRLFGSFVNIEAWWRKANLEFLKLAEKVRPNLVLVIATDGVRAGTLGQLRAQLPDVSIYCLFPDTPHNLVPDRIQSLPCFDRVATVSPAWIDVFERLGARLVHYLPLAADTFMHQPARSENSSSLNIHDVTFIGIWRPEREAFLEQIADFDLCIWGSNYWKRNVQPKSQLPKRWGGRPLFGKEFAQACARSRILINIIDGVGWPGPNMRTFEQPACRAFSLVTRTPAVTSLFKEGETIECFDSVAEARDKIRFYLEHESERQRIADAAYKYIVEGGHTYLDRAKQLISWAKEDGLS